MHLPERLGKQLAQVPGRRRLDVTVGVSEDDEPRIDHRGIVARDAANPQMAAQLKNVAGVVLGQGQSWCGGGSCGDPVDARVNFTPRSPAIR